MLPGVYITFDRVAEAVATDKPCRYRQVEWIPNGMAFGGGPPANRPPHCPPCSPARCASQLSFSIDRILAPDFGRNTARKAVTQPEVLQSTPKRDNEYDDGNSGIRDSERSKAFCDTRNFVENTPECILFGGSSSLSLEDPTFDTISVGVRSEFHNSTNCCIQNIPDHTTPAVSSVSIMIPEENYKPRSFLSISQTHVKELGRSSVDINCSANRENERLLEQYRSRSAHETFRQEISPLTDDITPRSPTNMKHLTPGDTCAMLISTEDSESAAVCKSGNGRSPTSLTTIESQECSEESTPVHYTSPPTSTETLSSDHLPAASNTGHLQTTGCSLPSSTLKNALLKTPTVNDDSRLCRSLSPSSLRTIEGNFRSEIPNDSKSVANADSSENRGSQNGTQQQEISTDNDKSVTWPAWVYCTRYSDRPSSGPRSRRKNRLSSQGDEKRSRTAFTGTQLSRLRQEFQENRYLTEQTRLRLAKELRLTESQVKIWFQNKRAKLKKSTGQKNPLALELMAQGLYRHSVHNDSKDN